MRREKKMAGNKKARRRPSTPNLKLSPQHLQKQQQHHIHQRQTADPTSPPETPMASPLLSRSKHQAPFYRYSRPLIQDGNIRPVGNGHQFSYQPIFGPEHLSPRSSSSSEAADDSDEDNDNSSSSDNASARSLPNAPRPQELQDEYSENADADDDGDDDDEDDEEDSESESGQDELEPEPPSDSGSDSDPERAHVEAAKTTVLCDFIIEDIDPMASDCEGLDVLFPTEIESNRSRSKSRPRNRDLDTGMMDDLKNLNCSNEASDNEPELDYDEEAFLKRQQELRRIRRVSMSSSVGKRTFSELSDSDGDDTGALDVNDMGSSARRMRKRLHRGSLLFQDPPAPRIDELEEPNSSEDEYAAESFLARELPYYTMEIMEMESSSNSLDGL